MMWTEIPIYVIDFEGSYAGGVVEYGVVKLRGVQIEETATRLCSPDRWITGAESAVHGIKSREVAAERPFRDDYPEFIEWRKTGVFAAHNHSVENHFLRKVWPSPPFVPDWEKPGRNRNDWGPWLDTLALYRKLYPDLEDHSLMALVSVFQESGRLTSLAEKYCPTNRCRPHAALYDALASALLLIRLAEDPGFSTASLFWMLDAGRPAGKAQTELFD